MLWIILVLLIAYGLGSIPFGLLLAKYKTGTDITKQGSGNIGATNVARICGKQLGAIVLLLDLIKGSLGAVVGLIIGGPMIAAWAGLAAVVGHVFPYWLQFKGGKGVATAVGVLLVISWPIALIGSICWYLIFMMLRISSVASISTTIICMVLAWVFAPYGTGLALTFICTLIIYRHKANILRLLRGEEKTL